MTTDAGWYAQPEGKQSYWDGEKWTAERDMPPPHVRKTAEQRERQGARLGLGGVGFVAAALVILGIGGTLTSRGIVTLLIIGFVLGFTGLVMWAAGMSRSS